MKDYILAICLAVLLPGGMQESSHQKLRDEVWTGVRGDHDPFSSYAPSHAIRALRKAIAFEGDFYIKQSIAQGKTDHIGTVFAVTCWGLQTTMSKSEQHWYATERWNLNLGETAGDWLQVYRAPSLVNTLQNIGDPIDREIYDILQAGQRRRDDRFKLARSGLAFYDAYKALSSSTIPEPRTAAGVDALKARIDRDDLFGDLKMIRAKLSELQKREWDSLLSTSRVRLRRTMEGEDPWANMMGRN